jgi:hypothetical protein
MSGYPSVGVYVFLTLFCKNLKPLEINTLYIIVNYYMLKNIGINRCVGGPYVELTLIYIRTTMYRRPALTGRESRIYRSVGILRLPTLILF